MSISEIEDILPRYQEIADGNKKSFNVAFDLIDTKFVSVYLGSDKQTSGFNVDIENKEVVFDSAPNSGLLVTIVRAVPVSWESTLHGAINSTSINSLLTHIVASIQTVQEEVSRAIKSNVYDRNDGGQLSEFFLKQLTDAQDILDRSENTLSLLNTTVQDALSSVETARSEAINDINSTYQENLNDINEASSTALSSIGSAKDSALAGIEGLVTSAEESEANAKVSETNAKASETKAQQIVDSIIDNSADTDLSNLSAVGQAKFEAKQNKLTAGTGISIEGNVISNTQISAEWGNIEGNLSSQTDLQNALNNKVSKTGDEDIDGIKAFKQGIKGTFENYYAYNGATNDKPWKKVMEITLSGTYNTINIPFMMNNPVSAKFGWGSGTINLRNENAAGTLNSVNSGIHFNILPNWWVHYDYKLLYKNNYPETGKILIEFWVKVSSTYGGVCFTILDMLSGGIGKFDRSKITWYNNTQQYAELPTGYNEISYTLDTMQTKTPQTGSNSKEIATTEWYNNKHKFVSALPSSPTVGVTYLIPQTEELTTTSYIPDYASYVDISDKTYTATQDGWIFWRGTGSGGTVNVNGVLVGTAGNYTDQPFAQFLVGKGDIITCNNKTYFRFIPFKK